MITPGATRDCKPKADRSIPWRGVVNRRIVHERIELEEGGRSMVGGQVCRPYECWGA